MRHPSARHGRRRHLSGSAPPPEPGDGGHWLLIGNSRWHWAEARAGGGIGALWDDLPGQGLERLAALRLRGWAAVGGTAEAAPLPCSRQLALEQVPLAGVPPWFGIDRALAGWWAWRQQGGAVLVADAGTVLSLTWIDGAGGLAGGRLLAGAALQWRAMAAGTALLPSLAPGASIEALEPWPLETAAAMRCGVLAGLAAAIAAAWRELPTDTARSVELWLTGGDAEALAPLLRRQGVGCRGPAPLALAALAALGEGCGW